jgi:hypothetical protein
VAKAEFLYAISSLFMINRVDQFVLSFIIYFRNYIIYLFNNVSIIQLICTVTPSSSNAEETHNTLKFAHRAKCIEIQASQNKVSSLLLLNIIGTNV